MASVLDMARFSVFSSRNTEPTIIDGPSTTPASPVRATSPRSQRPPVSQREFISRFDDFFPVAPPPRAHTRDLSHSSRSQGETGSSESLPPSYKSPDSPAPAYETVEEPETLSKCLFQYGFACPLFWLAGAIILCCDLRPIPQSECGKTAEEQAEMLAIIRKAELKWAKRSAIALAVFLLIICIAIVGLFAGGVFRR